MLGAWALTKDHSTILEVGTGTGIISLMLAQKNSKCKINAIDINQEAVHLADKNFTLSPWNKMLHVSYDDFKKPTEGILNQNYDHIISNPPFFTNGILSKSKMEQNSRHSIGIDFGRLVYQSSVMLSNTGSIQLILPYDRLEELTTLVKMNQLYFKRTTLVRPKPSKSPYRVLVEISKNDHPYRVSSFNMYTAEGKYSEAYKNLLADYMTIF